MKKRKKKFYTTAKKKDFDINPNTGVVTTKTNLNHSAKTIKSSMSSLQTAKATLPP